MVDIVANPEWKSVRILERDEVALGGYGGNMNEQATALVARTELLMQEKADTSDIIQGQYSFSTLAEFDSKKATIPANSVVIIDEAGANQGTNTWDGTTLTKSVYDPLAQAKIWATAEFENDILKPLRLKDSSFAGKRFNKAIKSLSLRGDHSGKLITVAIAAYVDGVFTIILARPDSVDEVMSAATNTKYVTQYSAANNFTGVQTLKLEPYGNVAAEISGEIIVDFGQLQQSDALSANYVANERVISSRNIIDLNGQYSEIKNAKNAAALVSGSDPKNSFINSAIEEIVFFKPIPTDKYFILSSLFYTTAAGKASATIHIYAADDEKSVGTVWAQGIGEIGADNRALIIFDQGYAIVRMGLYYPTNVGAAVLGDNATFETRGINKHFIKRGVLDSGIYQRYPKQFVDVSTFHIPTDYLQRSVKLYVKGEIADTDYYVLGVFNWSLTSSKYRLTYQIRKMSTPDQDIASGLIVYGGFVEFDSIEAIKGNVIVVPPKLNNHPFDAELEIDFTFLKYRTDNNNVYSPYVFNKAGTTYSNFGFDIQKLRKASSERFKTVGGGLTQYNSLKDALAVKEKGLFAIGGNTFKARNTNPLSKEDLICTNNPPKVLSKKPSKKEFDFYYKGSKIRLEQIDSSDTFYFLNAGFIVKAPHPMKQVWTQVANTSASDFVVYDHQTATHYSIADFTQLFTAAELDVPTISWLRLTYDDELLIIATDTVRVIMFTENNQSSLRTFNFNGSVGTKYAFGAGVNIVKDWCMSHHKNVMFFSDYDSGITTEGTNVRGTTGGNKCYVSLDNGYTFTQCFDFNGNGWTNVTNPSNIISHNSAQAHIHAVTYDPKQDIAWLVTGDGAISNDNSSFFWSRDKGQTWTHIRTTLVDGGRCQMIMALPFDGCVAFGSDASNLNGVGVITYNGEQMVHEVAKNFITSTGLYAFARSTWHSQKHGVKYMSFGQNVQRRLEPEAKSFVVASSNGYAWEEVWGDYSEDIYGNVYCYDDIDGNVYISLDGTNAYKERVVLCDVGYI